MNPHLLELRARIINSIILLTTIFILLFIVRDKLYSLIAIPIIKLLPFGSKLIATDITNTFLIPTKLSFILALYCCIPFIFYQIWQFIAPGLYKSERGHIAPLVVLSTLLFYIGNIFSFCILCPLALSFFINCAPKNVAVLADIKSYLDFIITVSFAGGVAFQVPVITKLLISFDICSKKSLQQKRSYVIVLAFILGMLLTPPDVVSQILLAIPIWVLFELGLLISKNPSKSYT